MPDRPSRRRNTPGTPPAIEAREVSRRFGDKLALDRVSLSVSRSEIHALLGPNGAGKTTLLRTFLGMIDPSSGSATVMGVDPVGAPITLRRLVGFVPAGDRSFYLRLSGLENLVFFGRLHGMSRRRARERAFDVLETVGLADAGRNPVSDYSHGMQKRLGVARALLTDPAALFVDEATHDLDPEAADNCLNLVRDLAARGAAVVWTTQRVDEIRGFADRVTLLAQGKVRFAGTVPELMAHALPRRYLLQLQNGGMKGTRAREVLASALGRLGSIFTATEEGEHYLLALREQAPLGDALARLREAGFQLIGCRDERSGVEEAFLALTREEQP
jgi:ABC-type multidrug transport system ATPase subunit